jgi:hypothetical protein
MLKVERVDRGKRNQLLSSMARFALGISETDVPVARPIAPTMSSGRLSTSAQRGHWRRFFTREPHVARSSFYEMRLL